MSSKSPEVEAIEITAPLKFHRLFTIPANDKHGPLKVTYSIAGIDKGEDIPTVLFCGGMFGTRWQAIFQDWTAQKKGVRVLFIDRFVFSIILTKSIWAVLISKAIDADFTNNP